MSAKDDADAARIAAINRQDQAVAARGLASAAIAQCSAVQARLNTVTQAQIDALSPELLTQWNALKEEFYRCKNALLGGDQVASGYMNGGYFNIQAGDTMYNHDPAYYGLAMNDYNAAEGYFLNAYITWSQLTPPANAASAALEQFMIDNNLGTE